MINFPDTPTLAQIFTAAGASWQWDGSKWEGATVASGSPYLPLTGGTLTGALNINAAGAGPSLTVKTRGVVIGNTALDPGLGGLTLNANAAAPPAALAGQGAAAIYAPDGTASALAVVGNTAPALRTVGFGGTLAAPLASPISSVIGQVATLGYNGAATALGAAINAVTDEAWTATANGAHLDFYCVPSGTAAPHITLGLHSNGQMIYDAAGNPPTGFQQGGGTINVASGYYVNGGGAAGVALVASGNSYINSGNVGIGTTTPVSPLTVTGNCTIANGSSSSLFLNLHFAGGWVYTGAGVGALLGLDPTGISFYTAPSGTAGAAAAPGLKALIQNSGTCLNSTGAWGVLSDASVKQEVKPYTRGLDAIVALNPVQFRYAAGTPFAEADKPSRQLFGLIAEEVKPHVPEVVGMTMATVGKKEGVELSTLEPGNLIYALINAIKELNAKVAAMSPPPARRKAA